MPKIKIKELQIPPSPFFTPQKGKPFLPILPIEILVTATLSALAASRILNKDHMLTLIALSFASQAADAAYRIKPTYHMSALGALGAIGAMTLAGDDSLLKPMIAGTGITVFLEELSPSQETLTWKKIAFVCADVFISYLAAGVGTLFIQPQIDPNAVITGMVAGHEISKILLKLTVNGSIPNSS